jgi:hypothetical protein
MRQATTTDPAMLAELAGFFDSTCTIRKKGAASSDTVGQPTTAFGDYAGHVDLACRVAPLSSLSSGGRKTLPEMVVSTTAVIIMLAGNYPTITTAMHAVVGSTTYQVVNVIGDSEALCTELVAEVVTT